jgi:hypothetical protein
MLQFVSICLLVFLKKSSERNFLDARHFSNGLKHPKNIATTMTRLSQKASSCFPHFDKKNLLFFFCTLYPDLRGCIIKVFRSDWPSLRSESFYPFYPSSYLSSCFCLSTASWLRGEALLYLKKTTKRSALLFYILARSLLVYPVSQMCSV